MRRNYWWWILGGGLAFLAAKAVAQKPTKLGEMAINVNYFKPEAHAALLSAILAANASCPGLPAIVRLTRGPYVAGGASGPGGTLSAAYFVEARWTHDVLGPIKGEVQACLEQALRAVDPNFVVTATRLS